MRPALTRTPLSSRVGQSWGVRAAIYTASSLPLVMPYWRANRPDCAPSPAVFGPDFGGFWTFGILGIRAFWKLGNSAEIPQSPESRIPGGSRAAHSSLPTRDPTSPAPEVWHQPSSARPHNSTKPTALDTQCLKLPRSPGGSVLAALETGLKMCGSRCSLSAWTQERRRMCSRLDRVAPQFCWGSCAAF